MISKVERKLNTTHKVRFAVQKLINLLSMNIHRGCTLCVAIILQAIKCTNNKEMRPHWQTAIAGIAEKSVINRQGTNPCLLETSWAPLNELSTTRWERGKSLLFLIFRKGIC